MGWDQDLQAVNLLVFLQSIDGLRQTCLGQTKLGMAQARNTGQPAAAQSGMSQWPGRTKFGNYRTWNDWIQP